jgi:hypothetical protein
VTSGGQVYVSQDSGTNWTARATSQLWTSVAVSADGSKMVGSVYGGTLYTSEKVKGMIRNQQEKYNWDVMFLAANQDAILAAKELAIPSENAINFSPSGEGVKMAFSSLNTDINHRRESHRSPKPKGVK